MKKILLLEKSDGIAAAIGNEIENSTLKAEWKRVQSESEYPKELKKYNPDAIIANHDFMGSNGETALAIRNRIRPAAPYLIISDTIDERVIMKALKDGATSFISKDRINWIVPELKDAFLCKQKDSEIESLLLTEVAASFTEGFLICDAKRPDMPVIFCNEAYSRITGYTPEQVIGHGFRFLQDKDNYQEETEQIREALKNGMPCQTVIRNYNINGELFWNRLNISPIRNKDNQVTHFACISSDITGYIKEIHNLDRSLNEKEVLLKEIHHRVKNNLAILSGMMDMQSEYTDSPTTRRVLKECKNRIKSIADIHEKLYQSPSLSDIDFKDYLEGLLISINKTFNNDFKHIKIDINSVPLKVNVNQAIPMALILNELITNSFEHGFPATDNGVVSVHLSEENSYYILVVKDNGIGIPSTVDLKNPKSLGLLLIKALARQLEAGIEYDNTNGTCVTLRFRVQ